MTGSIPTIQAVGESKHGISPIMLAALADLKERQFIPQQFKSLFDMWQALGIPSPRPVRNGFWRLTPVIAGYIPFLPNQQQLLLVATDGHQAVFLKPQTKHFVGLLQNFVPKEQLQLPGQDFDSYFGRKIRQPKAVKPRREKITYEEFC